MRLSHPALPGARGRARRLALLLAAGAALACAGGESPREPAPRAAQAAARTSTRRMADTLAVLVAQARESPRPDVFANRERVAKLRSMLRSMSGAEALNTRNFLADEMLKAGQPREAIAEIESLLRDAGLSLDTSAAIDAPRKPVFDLLAIAYLRLGEQENCLDNPAMGTCILPLNEGGRHTREEGARGAIARYGQILRSFPNDYGSRYLLNVAWLAVGGYPDSVPRRFLIPKLAPGAGASFPRFHNVAGEVGAAVTGLSGALSIEDFNGDGLLDLLTTSWGPNDPAHLFVADGHGGYTDRTEASGLKGIVGGLTSVDADYDNDGDVDVLVMRGAWLGEDGRYPSSLLRNRGDGTFEDVTFPSGILSFQPTHTAAWGDYNLDGWLDLFIGHESDVVTGGPSHPSQLFLNNRDGTFTEVSRTVGIALDALTKGAVWGDVNNDGLPDLYVSVMGGPNRLYVNRGATGAHANDGRAWRFEERGAAAGVTGPSASFPTWFWDYDNDGWDDILALSFDARDGMEDSFAREMLGMPVVGPRQGGGVSPIESSRLYRNKGDGTFEDASDRAGLAGKAIFAMGSNFGDLDNDGWLDFYVGTGATDLRSIVPNRMFRGVGGRRFEEVTLPGGFGHIQKGHGTAFADLDRDGDEDVYMVLGGAFQGDRATSVLFENPGAGAGNRWIALELEGRTANRSAIGARVEVEVRDAGGATRVVRRTVGTGGSFGAGPLLLHVGLGPAAAVREVRVRWPDAARSATSYRGLSLGATYHVTQGAEPVKLDRPAVPFRKHAMDVAGR